MRFVRATLDRHSGLDAGIFSLGARRAPRGDGGRHAVGFTWNGHRDLAPTDRVPYGDARPPSRIGITRTDRTSRSIVRRCIHLGGPCDAVLCRRRHAAYGRLPLAQPLTGSCASRELPPPGTLPVSCSVRGLPRGRSAWLVSQSRCIWPSGRGLRCAAPPGSPAGDLAPGGRRIAFIRGSHCARHLSGAAARGPRPGRVAARGASPGSRSTRVPFGSCAAWRSSWGPQ